MQTPVQTPVLSIGSDPLPRLYEVDSIRPAHAPDKARPVIIIRRKPSEIPGGLDLALIRLAGAAQMNGPENYVQYEFLLPERFAEAEKYLSGCGWKRGEVNGGR